MSDQPLREVIAKFNLRAKKSLGQNFLMDGNINDKIARAAAPQDALVMEVGAGPGGLTRALLAHRPKKLFAVELDSRAIPALEELRSAHPTLNILAQDALHIDPAAYHIEKIVGNLPFNVASPLLALWLLAPKPTYKKIIILVQKEVALRMVAAPQTKAYGRLSLLCQWRGLAKILFTIPASAFTPRPKVDSALVEIDLTLRDDDPTPQAIDWVSRTAFSQRRKMLRTHKVLLPLLEKMSLDPTQRAEELSVADYRSLAQLAADIL